jgi:uncharacterized Zn-finger protein
MGPRIRRGSSISCGLRGTDGGDMACGYCGSPLHTLKNCPKTLGGQGNRRAMRCSYCGSTKHTVKACPKTWAGSAARAWHPKSVRDDFVED